VKILQTSTISAGQDLLIILKRLKQELLSRRRDSQRALMEMTTLKMIFKTICLRNSKNKKNKKERREESLKQWSLKKLLCSALSKH
jgi:hypothetical protein